MRRCLTLLLILLGAFAAFAATGDAPDRKAHFVWGADFGSSIDLSGHDMSSIDFNAYFGLQYRWISLFGLGAGADIMVSNSCRTYPVYATLRTFFSAQPKLLFMDLRGGLALNYLENETSKTGGYLSTGVGVNLAHSRKFDSYIIASYTLVTRGDVTAGGLRLHYPHLDCVSLRLGITF